MPTDRPAYSSDVSNEEWALVAPYLALLRESSAQREHDLREVFNGLRYIVKTGAPWRFIPHDLPPWAAVYQQTQRWLSADSFADVAGDLRAVLRMAAEREPEPSGVILDSRTLRSSSPESGERAGYDGAKRKRGAKVHLAVDTPGHVVALHVTPASTDDRAEVGRLAAEVQAETGDSVELGFVDQGYSGPKPAAAARANSIDLEVVKAPEAKRGFVLLPRRWVVERSFAWATRYRRLVKDYERYASTLAGLHMVAFVFLMLKQAEKLMTST
ncbi:MULTISPECIES: IS5 family transposase [Methylobacterium]|uniref:IS5 family transposase n=1 Tax=Methylobacterium TaxID=407 RepID=UPI0013ED803D|nr:IS5 family transposase [Methylobacterium sp. DB0501]NGM38127.1 IS5 family transposase [Methylobacterium sp. DB0501]